jgi:hypothetical protein
MDYSFCWGLLSGSGSADEAGQFLHHSTAAVVLQWGFPFLKILENEVPVSRKAFQAMVDSKIADLNNTRTNG